MVEPIIKFKWWFPFTGFTWLATPPSPDPFVRWSAVIGTLAVAAILLAIIQPWREDPAVTRG